MSTTKGSNNYEARGVNDQGPEAVDAAGRESAGDLHEKLLGPRRDGSHDSSQGSAPAAAASRTGATTAATTRATPRATRQHQLQRVQPQLQRVQRVQPQLHQLR